MTLAEHVRVCEEAARAGGRVLLEWWDRFQVREKGANDLVTQADLASQAEIRGILERYFPHHGFLGEEEGADWPGSSGFRWLVDPLDGTTNYVHRIPQFCVSIGLERSGVLETGVIYSPVDDLCYVAQRGGGATLNGRQIAVSQTRDLSQALVAVSFPAKVERSSPDVARFLEALLATQGARRNGSAALNLAAVASGQYDAYWASSTKLWDVAAGLLLVAEAGGCVSALDGGPLDLGRPAFLAAGTRNLHEALLQLFAEIPA